MSREEQVEKLTAYMANFIGYTAKVLPDHDKRMSK